MPEMMNTQGSSVDLGTYVINPEEVLSNLEIQYAKYTSLPLDLARKVDDICLQKHGLTNSQLYNDLKARMIDNIIDPEAPKIIGVREDFVLPDNEIMTSSQRNEAVDDPKLLAKVEKAKSMESDTCVIIFPDTITYPYTMEDLEELFQRFNFLSFDLQQLSDQECIKLFGNDNRYMYETIKARLLARQNDREVIDPIEADSYFTGVTTMSQNESVGILELFKKKLDILNIKENGTLYESNLADDGLEDIDSAIHLKKTAGEAVPEFTPYLIPTEIEQLVGDGSGLSNDEREFLELYKNSLMEGMKNFDSKSYFNTIKSLYEEKSQNDSQSYIINMRMEAYGWNPNLPFNERSFKGARTRIINYLNEFYNPTIVDLQNFDESEAEKVIMPNLNEGVIMLIDTGASKFFTFTIYAEDWYHNVIPIVSQSVDKDTEVKCYLVFVDPAAKRKIFATFRSNNEYGIKNIWDTFLPTDSEKVTCVKFLAVLAKMCDGEVVPGAQVYKIFDNKWSEFVYNDIEKLVSDLKNPNPNLGKVLSVCSIGEATLRLEKHRSIAYLKNLRCNESEIEGNSILREMKTLITPTVALSEAKQIPIRINDKGVVVDLPTIIEEEYQTIHKAMLVYDEKNDYEAMKDSLAHLWYLNLLCERKITRWKDKEKKQQQLKISRDMRARILNDFKKYLKKVIENDPEFDFVLYFKKSRWNDKSIFIDIQTIKYTGKIIAAIVKSLLKK